MSRWKPQREGRHVRLTDERGVTVGWVYEPSLVAFLCAVPRLDRAMDRLTLGGCEPSLEERIVPAWGRGKATYAPDGVKYVPIMCEGEAVASIRMADARMVSRAPNVQQMLRRVLMDPRTNDHHKAIAQDALMED